MTWDISLKCGWDGAKMVRSIMRDPLFLAGKSEPATEADKQVVQDLLDTLKANQDRCVGMAANMIGVKKNIIVVAVSAYIRSTGHSVSTPCGGRGNCGKCKVRVLDGELKISTMDRIQLTEDELSRGIRLACQAMPKQTVKIEI